MNELKAAEEWWNAQPDRRKVGIWRWITQPRLADLNHPDQLDLLEEMPNGEERIDHSA
ncbi:hypothetical protein WG936_08125 [Corynebacterium sp. H127]|uniref:hypothetical protein n=1 Tax=Corynebacterium sp. H127 TaxID=3133418 RepID=UPI003094F00C